MKREEIIKKVRDGMSTVDKLVIKDIISLGNNEEVFTMFCEHLIMEGYFVRVEEEKK